MSRFATCATQILLAVLSFIPVLAGAQTGSFGSGSAVGLTVQAIRTDDGFAEVPAVELHITSIRPSGFAVDLGLATIPSALASGLLLLAPDVGIAHVFPVGGGGLMIKGGPSGVVAAAEGLAGGAWGFHVGAAALLRLGNSFGIRAEVVPRFYAFGNGIVQLTTFGIGFTSLPSRPR
jgi:hypothetical protein